MSRAPLDVSSGPASRMPTSPMCMWVWLVSMKTIDASSADSRS